MKQRSKALFTVAGAFIVLAAILYSCGGGGGGLGYGSSSTPPAPTSTVQVVACSSVTPATTVIATDDVFTNSAVHAPVGGVVMWTNNGTMQHSVTSGATPGTPDGQFDQTFNPAQSVCLKFTTAGTYSYYCKFHYTLGMIGSVTVP